MDARFSTNEHFRRGCDALAEGSAERALVEFRAARRLDPASPRVRSYYGLCLALAERRFDEALELCRAAAREEFYNPALYHNLARVHLAFGFKADAIRYLRRGLMIDPADSALRGALDGLGLRRRPVLAFLRRQHPFNRWAGWVRGRVWRREGGLEALGLG